jgi:thiamine pyrophosphate-dependent acetolactate synthase large subunit-like protein
MEATLERLTSVNGKLGTVSGWVSQVRQSSQISKEVAGAISAALTGCVATVSVPHDFQMETVPDDITRVILPSVPKLDMDAIAMAATARQLPLLNQRFRRGLLGEKLKNPTILS